MDFTSKEILTGTLVILGALISYILGSEKKSILKRLDFHEKKLSEHDLQLKEIHDMQKNVIDNIERSTDVVAKIVRGYIDEIVKK